MAFTIWTPFLDQTIHRVLRRLISVLLVFQYFAVKQDITVNATNLYQASTVWSET